MGSIIDLLGSSFIGGMVFSDDFQIKFIYSLSSNDFRF